MQLEQWWSAKLLMTIAALLLVTYVVYTYFFNSLSYVPGPAISRISNFWKVKAAWHEDLPKRLIALHREHGPIVRVGPDTISLNDPAAYPIIYGVKQGFKKTRYLAAAEAWYKGKPMPTTITTTDEDYHTHILRVARRPYSSAAGPQVEIKLQPLVELMVRKLDNLDKTGLATVDVAVLLSHYAMDAMAVAVLSEAMGFVETGKDLEGAIGAVNILNKYFSIVTQAPWVHKFLLGNRFAMSFLEKQNPIMNFALPRIERREREQQTEASADLLGILLEANASVKDPGAKLTLDQIVMVTVSSIQAGYATITVALRSIIYQLARNHRVQQRLQRELADSSAIDEQHCSSQVAEAAKLPYLNAVIIEALRTNPVPGLILERQVPAGGVVLDGRHIPAGTSVGFNPWVILSNTQVYGEDAHLFTPERWLEASEERLREMRRCNISFGAGSRACQGKGMAMMVIMKLIPVLVSRYNFVLAKPSEEWKVTGHFFTFQSNVDVVITPRNV
ncbi:putative Pisatin demethylase [Seiridium unicorne]|uniref:Pisatin demethylase n=1 Tax=Seiridium unicorne TaxID=138068 RepID=A0ABR2UJK2_9PEZI